MSSTTVNAINHSVQYLIREVDIMFIVVKHRLKQCKLQYQSNRINQNYKTLLF